jgi:hypothetical protein
MPENRAVSTQITSIFERLHLIDVCPVCGDFPREQDNRFCGRCQVPGDRVWVRIVREAKGGGDG